MIQIKRVRFQNAFSFGNELWEIAYDDSRPTLGMGLNGHGKSAGILDMLVYGLYGKPYKKVKLGQMINSITGRDLMVEVDFRTRGSNWRVRRGMKPSLFEVYQDEKLIDQSASTRDQQEWLEKSVLMMDSKTFTQIVILGAANHVPFMQLSASQRREVIEDILDLQVFSRMNDVLKEKIKLVKEEVTGIDRDLAVKTRELEVEERHFHESRRDIQAEREEILSRIRELQDRESYLNESMSRVSNEISDLTGKTRDYNDLLRKLRDLQKIKSGLDSKIHRLESELEFFQHHETCPTCSQMIDEGFRIRETQSRRTQVEELLRGVSVLDEKTREIEERISSIDQVQSRISELDRELVKYRTEMISLESNLDDLKKKMKDLNDSHSTDERVLESLREEVGKIGSARDEVTARAKIMGQASLLLKDQGIKARILSRYIPIMNRLINKYLSEMELYVDFQLDENFEETIRSRHRDTFSYSSFSEGEKRRIDLSILFAWRDVAKMRNSSAVDLIIFDEILDSSLDAQGIDYFMKIIREVVQDTHVVIISHRDGMEDKFERVLTFEKKQNFSRIIETG